MEFEQGGDEKYGEVSVVAQVGVKELAQGGNWTLVKSPRQVVEKLDQVHYFLPQKRHSFPLPARH